MTVELGIKSDPVLYRYSFDWLFDLMSELEVPHLQLGSWTEMYWLPDRSFERLRSSATSRGVSITSCFTSLRELGGLLSSDPDLQAVAAERYKRLIDIGAIVGARSVGSNPGAILRDRMEEKPAAIERYLTAMEEIRLYAERAGIEVLTLETMSSIAEPPTTKDEITYFMERLNPEPSSPSVPIYICSDVSHGYADDTGTAVQSNLELFEHAIPWTWEIHLKNTDSRFHSTFGFGSEPGIVDLGEIARLISSHAGAFPTDRLIAYLELPGPKLGRDYADNQLESQFRSSFGAIHREFVPRLQTAAR